MTATSAAGRGPLEALTDGLELDQLAALTAGEDDWRTVELPEVGVPRLKLSDGPVGVRGESYTTTTSALFPCGAALGATFDPALVHRIGAALGDEARTKRAHVLLGPTLNIARHPLGGRNFESYGEDPLLVAATAVAMVTGIQSRRVGACVKHLVANDAEIERLTISSEVDERTLREVYLWPFEAAVVDGRAWAMMASYNKLNGVFACDNEWLLTSVVRGDWGFDGLLVSDWFATHDTERGVRSGLDLEMPGPPRHFGPAVAAAVREGRLHVESVRPMAERLLRLADRTVRRGGADEGRPWVGTTRRGGADEGRPRVGTTRLAGTGTGSDVEGSVDDPARWALAVEASAASMVLLRNEEVGGQRVLPLEPSSWRRVAVIGPDAAVAVTQGGGSARVNPHRTVSPLAGLADRLGPAVEVVHAPGCARGRPLPVLDTRLAPGGVRLEYRTAPDGPLLASGTIPRFDPVWSGRFHPAVDPLHFHLTATATLMSGGGSHELELTSVGPCVALLDGEVVLDNRRPDRGTSFFGYGSSPISCTVHLQPGRAHELRIDYPRPPADLAVAAVRVGIQAPLGDDPLADAVALAAGADVALVLVGTNEDVECEGFDRATMDLPGGQDDLVRAIAAANPRTVVAVVAGAPVSMPWADDVAVVLVTWFGGMAVGEALAAVLVGDREPGGRLPVTIPRQVDDAPCRIAVADPPGQLRYTEGLAVGHRSYVERGVEPRFWFGSGGSFTEFDWGTPVVTSGLDGPIEVLVPVRNVGPRSGRDVVQVYVHRPAGTVPRPRWILGGFGSTVLEPGASEDVVVRIDERALRHWRPGTGWAVEPGPVDLRVARSAGDPGIVISVALRGSG